MTGVILTLGEDTNKALKNYAVIHGNISKDKAAAQLIEQWLTEKGYLEYDPLDYDPTGVEYENT